MDRTRIAQLIATHEGKRYLAYRDTAGLLTIGIGFNLERRGGKQHIEALNLNYDDVCSGTCSLEDDHVQQLFEYDMNQAIADAAEAVETFPSLPDEAQAVVVDMIFNLGSAGFRKFKKLIAALEVADFCTAANEMQDSQWSRQVLNRAKDDIYLIRQFCEEERS